MIKLQNLIEERTFFDIRNEEDPNGTNHDLRLICTKCGVTETCKCSKPKRKFYGVCHGCAGIGYNGEKL
jgi:hypothetical protein